MFRHTPSLGSSPPPLFFTASMKIAAFNIQKFGKTKMSDPEVLNILVKVTHTHTFPWTHNYLTAVAVQMCCIFHTSLVSRTRAVSLLFRMFHIPCVGVCLPQIVSRYDIILILEVVDISGEAVKTFLDALNKLVLAEFSFSGLWNKVQAARLSPVLVWRSSTKHHYTMKISSRLGRTRYKEQFLFLFRYEGTFPLWLLKQNIGSSHTKQDVAIKKPPLF